MKIKQGIGAVALAGAVILAGSSAEALGNKEFKCENNTIFASSFGGVDGGAQTSVRSGKCQDVRVQILKYKNGSWTWGSYVYGKSAITVTAPNYTILGANHGAKNSKGQWLSVTT